MKALLYIKQKFLVKCYDFFVEVECIEFPLHEKFPVIWTKNRKVIVENVGYNKYELFYHVFFIQNINQIPGAFIIQRLYKIK